MESILIRYTKAELQFLCCIGCKLLIDPLKSKYQTVCSKNHFTCMACEDRHQITTCACGADTESIMMDASSPTSIAFFCKYIVSKCPDCPYTCTGELTLSIHRQLSCPANRALSTIIGNQSMRAGAVVQSDSPTVAVIPAHSRYQARVAFPTHLFVLQQELFACTLCKFPVAVILASKTAISHTVFTGAKTSVAISTSMHMGTGAITVYLQPLFKPIPGDIDEYIREGKSFTQCQISVPRWLSAAMSATQKQGNALLFEESSVLPMDQLRPSLGVCQQYYQLAVFDDTARLIFGDSYLGGSVFYVCGREDDGINEFFIFVAHLAYVTYILCPCCLVPFTFQSFAVHICVSEEYIYNLAERFDMGTKMVLDRSRLTRCGQRTFAADFKTELLPTYQFMQIDIAPLMDSVASDSAAFEMELSCKPAFYGLRINVHGRSRLSVVRVTAEKQVSCVFCGDVLEATRNGVVSHFNMLPAALDSFLYLDVNCAYYTISFDKLRTLGHVLRR